MKKRILTVLMHPEDAPADAAPVELTVTTILADQILAERQMRMRKAGIEDYPILFGSALAWAALAREGRTSLDLEAFANVVFDITREQLDKDDAAVDPPRPAASSDSA